MGWFSREVQRKPKKSSPVSNVSSVENSTTSENPISSSSGGGFFGSFFGGGSSSSSSSSSPSTSSGSDDDNKKIEKQLSDLTLKIEDLSNEVYKLTQRVDELEKRL